MNLLFLSSHAKILSSKVISFANFVLPSSKVILVSPTTDSKLSSLPTYPFTADLAP